MPTTAQFKPGEEVRCTSTVYASIKRYERYVVSNVDERGEIQVEGIKHTYPKSAFTRTKRKAKQ